MFYLLILLLVGFVAVFWLLAECGLVLVLMFICWCLNAVDCVL